MASHGVPRVSAASRVKDDAAQQREQKEIKKYQDLVAKVLNKDQERICTPESLQLNATLLQKNPEYYTIWNARRRILLDLFNSAASTATTTSPGNFDVPATSDNLLSGTKSISVEEASNTDPIRDLIAHDLTFLIPLLIKYPKCYWLWNHRQWLLSHATALLPTTQAQRFWQEELGLVSKMLHRDRRNFHGWGYRRIVVQGLEALHTTPDTPATSMTKPELEYTTTMISTDLSNFSAWHARSQLLPRLLDEQNADHETRVAALNAEFELSHNALLDPVDQSPWFYHQFLISTLMSAAPAESTKGSGSRIVLEVTDELCADYLDREIEFIKEMLEDETEVKWVYLALVYYSEMFWIVKGRGEGASEDEMRQWLGELRRLDPMRKGKWEDLTARLELNG